MRPHYRLTLSLSTQFCPRAAACGMKSRPERSPLWLTRILNRPLGVVPPLCSPIDDTMRRAPYRCFLLFFVASLRLSLVPSFAAAQDQQPTIRLVRNPDP